MLKFHTYSILTGKMMARFVIYCVLKFIFSKKTTKIDEIFTVDLTLCSKRQSDGEDFSIFVAFLKNINFKINSALKTSHSQCKCKSGFLSATLKVDNPHQGHKGFLQTASTA